MTSKDDLLSEIETDSKRYGNEYRPNADSEENELVKEQRIAVVDEVEDLIRDVEATTGRLAYIRKNTNLARDSVLDDSEYNHCVQVALLQLTQAAERKLDDATEIRRKITALREQLSEKAALSPQEQITR